MIEIAACLVFLLLFIWWLRRPAANTDVIATPVMVMTPVTYAAGSTPGASTSEAPRIFVVPADTPMENYVAGAADSALFNRLRGKIIVAIRNNQSRSPRCSMNAEQPWHLDNSCNADCYKLAWALRTLDAIESAVSGTESTKAVPFDVVLSYHVEGYPKIPTSLYLRNLEVWVDDLCKVYDKSRCPI